MKTNELVKDCFNQTIITGEQIPQTKKELLETLLSYQHHGVSDVDSIIVTNIEIDEATLNSLDLIVDSYKWNNPPIPLTREQLVKNICDAFIEDFREYFKKEVEASK